MIAIFGHRGNKNAYPRSIFAIIHPLEPEQNPRDSLIRDYIFFIFHQIIPCILTTWPSPLPNKTNLLCTNFVQRISLFFVESYFEQNFTQNYFSLHKFRTTNFLIFFLFNNERFIFTRLLFFVNFRLRTFVAFIQERNSALLLRRRTRCQRHLALKKSALIVNVDRATIRFFD